MAAGTCAVTGRRVKHVELRSLHADAEREKRTQRKGSARNGKEVHVNGKEVHALGTRMGVRGRTAGTPLGRGSQCREEIERGPFDRRGRGDQQLTPTASRTLVFVQR